MYPPPCKVADISLDIQRDDNIPHTATDSQYINNNLKYPKLYESQQKHTAHLSLVSPVYVGLLHRYNVKLTDKSVYLNTGLNTNLNGHSYFFDII